MVMNFVTFETNLHMIHHYKRVNSAKSVINTSAPKTYNFRRKQSNLNTLNRSSQSTPLIVNKDRTPSRTSSNCELRHKKCFTKCDKKTDRSCSVPPRPTTRRNPNMVPQNYIKVDNNFPKINNNDTKKIPIKFKCPYSTTYDASYSQNFHENQAICTKPPVPLPRQKCRSSNVPNCSVSDYEYLQFALRITEDIIRNDLYSQQEMVRVFNSHIEANRGRLSMTKMLQQIEHLCTELNITAKTQGPSPDSTFKVVCKCKQKEKCTRQLFQKVSENEYVITDKDIKKLTESELQDMMCYMMSPQVGNEIKNKALEYNKSYDETDSEKKVTKSEEEEKSFNVIHNNENFTPGSTENLTVISSGSNFIEQDKAKYSQEGQEYATSEEVDNRKSVEESAYEVPIVEKTYEVPTQESVYEKPMDQEVSEEVPKENYVKQSEEYVEQPVEQYVEHLVEDYVEKSIEGSVENVNEVGENYFKPNKQENRVSFTDNQIENEQIEDVVEDTFVVEKAKVLQAEKIREEQENIDDSVEQQSVNEEIIVKKNVNRQLFNEPPKKGKGKRSRGKKLPKTVEESVTNQDLASLESEESETSEDIGIIEEISLTETSEVDNTISQESKEESNLLEEVSIVEPKQNSEATVSSKVVSVDHKFVQTIPVEVGKTLAEKPLEEQEEQKEKCPGCPPDCSEIPPKKQKNKLKKPHSAEIKQNETVETVKPTTPLEKSEIPPKKQQNKFEKPYLEEIKQNETVETVKPTTPLEKSEIPPKKQQNKYEKPYLEEIKQNETVETSEKPAKADNEQLEKPTKVPEVVELPNSAEVKQNDFVSAIESSVQKNRKKLYGDYYVAKPKHEAECSGPAIIIDYNKYENPCYDCDRLSHKSHLSEGEIFNLLNPCCLQENKTTNTMQSNILSHLKKYEQPVDDNYHSLCMCGYELNYCEDRIPYGTYVPKFDRSLFFPDVSTQTSNVKFDSKFDSDLLSDGEILQISTENEMLSDVDDLAELISDTEDDNKK